MSVAWDGAADGAQGVMHAGGLHNSLTCFASTSQPSLYKVTALHFSQVVPALQFSQLLLTTLQSVLAPQRSRHAMRSDSALVSSTVRLTVPCRLELLEVRDKVQRPTHHLHSPFLPSLIGLRSRSILPSLAVGPREESAGQAGSNGAG
eukprot:1722755-Rhodomonas_salina.1